MKRYDIPLPRVQRTAPETTDSPIQMKYDVEQQGYVVEEYYISGQADTYESVTMADSMNREGQDPTKSMARRDFHRPVIKVGEPYTTRILVHRPKDSIKFSGNVVIEPVHPLDNGVLAVWVAARPFFLDNGDVYVGVQHPSTFAALRKFNEKRYSALNMPDFTQLWGSLAQIGALLKSDKATNPLHGFNVRYLFMTGISYTGVATATFANYHHISAKLTDGRNIFDGYVPIANAMYNRPLDVPTIRIVTQSDYGTLGGLGNRRPDSDEPGSQYRLYEIPGAPHTPRPPKLEPDEMPSDFPNGIFYGAAFKNMYNWVRGGASPPKGKWIATDADGNTKLDKHGNAIGGIRSPYVDTPIAKYTVKGLLGYKVPFDAAKKKSLYGSHENYVMKVEEATRKLIWKRLILPAGAIVIINHAKNSEIF